uniref:Uncharacterized protein n=1 Tax=Arundo donax TaxID=35708 RepID=A0A0A9BGE4_ARUDO
MQSPTFLFCEVEERGRGEKLASRRVEPRPQKDGSDQTSFIMILI